MTTEAQTRSTAHEDIQTAPTTHASFSTFRMVAQVILQETESGRDNKGHAFAPQVFEGASLSMIKERIWDFILMHLQPLATYTGLPKVWSVSSTPPTISDIDKYIVFKFNKQIITDEEKLKKRVVKNKNETFTVITYKWGCSIKSSTDLLEFKTACIDPVSVDRAGADDENQQVLVQQLKDQWGDRYQAHEPVWRMWASMIYSKRAQFNVPQEIKRPPPRDLLLLFTPTATRLQGHVNNLEETANMGIDVVRSCLEEHQELRLFLKTTMESLEAHMDAMKEVLDTKLRCFESFARSAPCRHDPSSALLNVIPNVPDIDHAYQLDTDDDMT
ncbi:unnamed protein product [Aphanomyces euteiches]|nr:hypothetical protein AeRB84_003738 [Aphanomyces euteiches]